MFCFLATHQTERPKVPGGGETSGNHAVQHWDCMENAQKFPTNSEHILSWPRTVHFLQKQSTSALSLPVHHVVDKIFTGPGSGRTWHVPWQSFFNCRLYYLL
jgi:hypothetical protein